MVKLHFLGAAGTVTGSRYLLESGGVRTLVDCGLFQGYKSLRLRNWAEPPFDASSIEAVLLTHAHLDHSGYLPVLMKYGFRGKIHCTESTYELCKLLLRDSAYLLEEEAAYLNRHQISKHHPALPLYDVNDVVSVLKRFHVVSERKVMKLPGGFNVQWIPNGHILGSCCVACDIDGTDFLFSGDVGRPHDVIMRPPEIPGRMDYLIVESTYGDRIHDAAKPEMQLKKIILETINNGGSILIPSFAVGRAQTLLYLLYKLHKEKQIPHLPIYVDSPMSDSATRIYRKFAPELHLSQDDVEGMIAMTQFTRTVEESQRINSDRWPKIVISASGMATGGRVVHHLKYMAPDARNTIVFSGYQAGGTRGDSIVRGAQTVRIHGQDVPIRATVFNLETISAHADCVELVAWLKHFKHAPVRTFITHGEPPAADALRIKIEHELNWDCEVPEYLNCYQIDKNRVHLAPRHMQG